MTRRTASYGGDFGDDESGDDFFTSAFGGNDEEGSDDILSTLLGLGKGKGGNDEDESGDDFFASAFGGNHEEGSDDILSTLLGLGEGESDGNMIESFEQCGIDVGDMVAKVSTLDGCTKCREGSLKGLATCCLLFCPYN